MSKASKYAEASKMAAEVYPPGFTLSWGNPQFGVQFSVSSKGMLAVSDKQFSALEALKLRDWLTETFDEVNDPVVFAGGEFQK